MNYNKLYNDLYKIGYHSKGKNHGQNYGDVLVRYEYKTILEVGCSNGLVVKLLQNNKRKAYGIDISEIAIHYACEKFGAINCCCNSAIDIPFKNNWFDAVFTCDVLEHLAYKDVKRALGEISRVCRKYFFVKVSNSVEHNREFLNKLHEKKEWLDVDNLHLTVMSYSDWIKLICDYGFNFYKEDKGLFVFEK